MKQSNTNTKSEERKVTQKELIQLMAGFKKKEELYPKKQKSKHSLLHKSISVQLEKNNKDLIQSKDKAKDLGEDRIKEKKLLEKFIKLNSELPFREQKTISSGKEVKKQALLKKTKKRIQQLKPNRGFGIG